MKSATNYHKLLFKLRAGTCLIFSIS